jgi:predicted transcriptional regulator
MTIPEKPSSRLQKYRLTPKGRAFLTKEAAGGKE